MDNPKLEVTAFVMMKVEPGHAKEALIQLEQKYKGKWKGPGKGITEAYVITGEYDIVAKVEVHTNSELLDLVDSLAKHSSPQLITKTQTSVASDHVWK